MWLNSFPRKGGISNTLSPRTIVNGTQFDFNKHCKCEFGSYVQTHDDSNIKNNMNPRTTGAICLGPTGNAQGTYKFMNLNSGKLITQSKWTEIPMSN